MTKFPDFKSHEERLEFFKEHAEYYTVTCQLKVGMRYKSQHQTLETAKSNAKIVARLANKYVMIYAVIGSYDHMITTVSPPTARDDWE